MLSGQVLKIQVFISYILKLDLVSCHQGQGSCFKWYDSKYKVCILYTKAVMALKRKMIV